MNKLTLLLIYFVVTILSCGNPKTTNAPEANLPILDFKDESEKLSGHLRKYEVPSEYFNVNSDKNAQLKGRKGTIISFNPLDLETTNGQPVGTTIQVELKEVTNQTEFLRSNIQTVSNGRLLISGGAYFINMISNGQQLRLKEKKSLEVRLPKLSNREMALFYGRRDSLGKMNWLEAGQMFESKDKMQEQPKTKIVTDSSRGELDQLLDYIESESKRPLTAEEKRQIEEHKKNSGLADRVYKAIEINQFGWINCDRFDDEPNKTNLLYAFDGKDSVVSANVYLVFKDINSLMQSQYFSFADKEYNSGFQNIPVGSKARLIAISLRNGKTYSFQSAFSIKPNQRIEISLVETSENKIGELFN